MNRIIIVLVIFSIGVIVSYWITDTHQNKRKLPVLSPCDVNPELYDKSLKDRCVGHKITAFKLIDQLGDKVNQDLLENRITIANFFFVSCPTICPIMTNQLKRVHDQYKNNDNVIILSHTVWPEIDSPQVLLNYANRHDADHEKWRFLTGEKQEIYRLARKAYLVAPEVNDPNFDHGGEADFIHTENIVLIDRKKRIRGFYDGTDSAAISQLILDIPVLLEN